LLERELEEIPWTIQQTFLGILLTLVPWIGLSFALSTASVGTPIAKPLPAQVDFTNAIITLIFSAIIEGAFLVAPFYFAHHPFRSSTHPWHRTGAALGFKKFKVGSSLAWVILLFIAVIVVNLLYQYAIVAFHLKLLPNDQRILAQGKLAPITTYATLLGSVLFAPFCEEIFFRGFTFMGLLRGMSLNVSIVLSALIFAVAHGDPGSFLVLFVIGLALAFLRWHTRSIWPCISLHLLNNLLGALSIFLSLQGIH
jgi:membrane protease YdiL (CAAX protease family)